MSATLIGPEEYREFRDFLEQACGIVLGENKQYLVSSRLARVMNEFQFASFGELLAALRRDPGQRLRNRIVEAMTTNETSWFRDNHPFMILKEVIFPELGRARRNPVRIWSAACSSGQEPYSVAMVLNEFQMSNPGVLGGEVQIVATDISPAMLDVARTGRYDGLSMARGLSPERKQRYFRQQGEFWEIIPALRERVQFRDLNLLQNFSLLGRFDVIFCRNVLIYFSADSKRDILARMARTLNPGGYLFLGGSESLTGLSDAFEMVRHGGSVVYRLKSGL